MDPSFLFIDSTHIKVNANKRRKYKKKFVQCAAQQYKEKLDQKVNENRILQGKKPFTPKMKKAEEHEMKESMADPESGYYVKAEREKQFAYSYHTACDRYGFVLGTIVTPGNVHDSIVFPALLQTITHHFGQPFAVVAESSYKIIPIAHHLLKQGILRVLPYTRSRGVKGMLKTKDFYYDEHFYI